MDIRLDTIKKYVTSDGREFLNKYDAENYEASLPLKHHYLYLRDTLQFKVTPEHIEAIKELNFLWTLHSLDFPSCILNPKRPFGNSNIYGDIAKILHITPNIDDEEFFTEKQEFEMLKFFLDLWVVLDILIDTCHLRPGFYERKDLYLCNTWFIVDEIHV